MLCWFSEVLSVSIVVPTGTAVLNMVVLVAILNLGIPSIGQ
eukprot:SAG31_NODE_30627_length_378_cov_0.942652_1_plen_40_part_01